jgi:hypothetical protein
MKTFDLMFVYLYNVILAFKCHHKGEKIDAVYYLV